MLGGDYERAQALFEAALETTRITGNRKGQAVSLNNLGLVALCLGGLRTGGGTLLGEPEAKR